MKPLRLDFESGDLSFWTAEGEAFANQPLRGDRLKASRVRPGLVPLGGDYWDGPYPVGHRGEYWISTENHLTGTLISDEFVINENYPWFSFLIGGGHDSAHLRVELLIKATAENQLTAAEPAGVTSYPIISLPGKGDFYRVFEATGSDSEVMHRVIFNVVDAGLTNQSARIRIVDNSTTHHINADDFNFSPDCPQVTPLAEGGGDPAAPVWGIADLHTHPMAALAFGGQLFWGQPDGPIETALHNCVPAHGIAGTGLQPKKGGSNFLIAFFEGTGYQPGIRNWLHPGHPVGGYPNFDGWPRFTTIIHQQMYIDWLRRTYEGGLRLMVAHVVNNELLAHEFGSEQSKVSHNDKTAVEVQITAMKALVARHAGWMEIAYSPADARRIIRQNKLAVILGVEVDSLGSWNREGDCTEDQVRAYLHHLYHDLGVRHLFPIHLANNAFGGAAVYNDLFNVINCFLRGDYFEVEDGSESNVQFRLGDDPGPAISLYQSPLANMTPHLEPHYAPPDYRKVPGGHVNVQGLTHLGRFLVKEMMRLGMLVDIDHMSYKAVDETLEIAERQHYPVVSGHTHFQELAWQRQETASIHKCSSEFFRTTEQIERIRGLGGMVAPILNQGDNRDAGDILPELAGKLAKSCSGSATSWAHAYLYAVEKMQGRGIGIGTDMNGFYKSPCPRFGMNASYYLHYNIPGMGEDRQRQALRRDQVEVQANGVCYDTSIVDAGRYRFGGVLEGEVYDDLERDIWQALALYSAGLNPWTGEQPIPALSIRVENLAKGFCATNDEQLTRPGLLNIGNGPWEQRAAFLVKTEQAPGYSERDPETVHTIYSKILPIWRRWHAMQGSNTPLSRSRAGQRNFDINIDGVAHYGMLPDFFQDLKNVGLTEEDLLPLFRSAEDYIQVWETCERAKDNQALT